MTKQEAQSEDDYLIMTKPNGSHDPRSKSFSDLLDAKTVAAEWAADLDCTVLVYQLNNAVRIEPRPVWRK